MSRGPGRRQRELLRAVESGGVVWAVPDHVNRRSEANARRRAARELVLKGRLRGIYLRRKDRAGRWFRALAVTAPDSSVYGDAWHTRSPGWVEVTPPVLSSFTREIQALIIAQASGVPCSRARAGKLDREFREQAA